MNGKTTSPMTPPPSVQRARATSGRRLPTFLSGKAIGIAVLVLAVGGFAVAQFVTQWAKKREKAPVSTSSMAAPWGRQKFDYPQEAVLTATPPAATEDTTAAELAKLRAEYNARLTMLANEVQELKNRKAGSTTTTVINQGNQGAGQQPKRPTFLPAPALFEAHDVQGSTPEHPTVGDYSLAPWATHLPCTIQPHMNSDVPGYFTAKVSQNVYDTKTGQHLLVPQGSTIGGQDHGGVLLYGNERLPTTGLGLTIEDRHYDLGEVPVLDHQGTNGLVDSVNTHFWRNVGAIFIGGALRGGQQALSQAIASSGGASQVIVGVGSMANQVGQQRLGRALDTRPTIEVYPGHQCNVLLTKELRLPAVWQGTPTPATMVQTPSIRRGDGRP